MANRVALFPLRNLHGREVEAAIRAANTRRSVRWADRVYVGRTWDCGLGEFRIANTRRLRTVDRSQPRMRHSPFETQHGVEGWRLTGSET